MFCVHVLMIWHILKCGPGDVHGWGIFFREARFWGFTISSLTSRQHFLSSPEIFLARHTPDLVGRDQIFHDAL